jgi:hypothetical protein
MIRILNFYLYNLSQVIYKQEYITHEFSLVLFS